MNPTERLELHKTLLKKYEPAIEQSHGYIIMVDHPYHLAHTDLIYVTTGDDVEVECKKEQHRASDLTCFEIMVNLDPQQYHHCPGVMEPNHSAHQYWRGHLTHAAGLPARHKGLMLADVPSGHMTSYIRYYNTKGRENSPWFGMAVHYLIDTRAMQAWVTDNLYRLPLACSWINKSSHSEWFSMNVLVQLPIPGGHQFGDGAPILSVRDVTGEWDAVIQAENVERAREAEEQAEYWDNYLKLPQEQQ
jgi:hypothetical protein